MSDPRVEAEALLQMFYDVKRGSAQVGDFETRFVQFVRVFPMICDECHEAAAQETVWTEGRKRDLCCLCALAYAGPSWSMNESANQLAGNQ